MLARFLAPATLVVACLFAPCSATALLIDDFSVGSFELTSYGPYSEGQVRATQDLSSFDGAPLGGGRNWFVTSQTAEPGSFGARVRVDPVDETFRFQSGAIGYFGLEYGGGDTLFDLIESGNDHLRFRMAGPLTTPYFVVVIESLVEGELSTAITEIGRPGIRSPDNAIFEVPYDEFRGDVDFSQVKSLRLNVSRFSPGLGFGIDAIEAVPTPTVGDYNRDDSVDYDDLIYWADSFSEIQRVVYPSGELVPYELPYPGLTVDGNNDGFIDAADFTVWRNAFEGYTIPNPGESSSAPEPAGIALVVIAMSAGFVIRRE